MARKPDQSLADVEIASLRGLDQQALTVIWRRLQRHAPPPAIAGDLLVRILAHDLQVARFGDLSMVARQRLKAAAKEASDAAGPSEAPGVTGSSGSSRVLTPGTRLLRDWQGKAHEVLVTRDGFVWQGETWRSLSTIARRITGTSWNGWTFFGVDRSCGEGEAKRSGKPKHGAKLGRGEKPEWGARSGQDQTPSQKRVAVLVTSRGPAHA